MPRFRHHVASSWLDRPIEGADARLHDQFAQAIRDAQARGPMTFGEQVERVLPRMVLSGMASAPAVAHLFGIHERTLRWRLEAEGKGLQQLIECGPVRAGAAATGRHGTSMSSAGPPCGTRIRMCSPGPSGTGLVSARRSGVPGSEPGVGVGVLERHLARKTVDDAGFLMLFAAFPSVNWS